MSELHSINLSSRNNLKITGIVDVGNFDENIIICKTEDETLCIKGQGLHIDRLDIESGLLDVSGVVHSLVYSAAGSKKESVWEKIFK